MKKKSQKQKKRISKRKTHKRGGFRNLIQDKDFKYTLNESRKVWVKNMYPNLNALLNTIQNIHWNEYQYNGDAIISFNVIDKDGEAKEPLHLEQIVNVSSEKHTLNYKLMGGICYEILSDVYKNVDLPMYIDPTGDIDIITRIPSIEQNPEIEEITARVKTDFQNELIGLDIYPKIKLITIDNKINPYHKHLLHWIFDNLKEQLDRLNINELFPNAVDFDILDEDYDEIPEAHRNPDFGFRLEKIGKANLVGFVTQLVGDESKDNVDGHETMLKVQLIFKIENNGVSIIDHVLEVIFTNRSGLIPTNELYEKYRKTSEEIKVPGTDKIFEIDNLASLIGGNIDAYKERVVYIERNDADNVHKAFNHIGRILYLFDIAKNNKRDEMIKAKAQSIGMAFGSRINSLCSRMIKEEIAERSKDITTTDPKEKNKQLLAMKSEVNDYVAKNFTLKIYKNNDDGNINCYHIKVLDFIMAFIDIFILYNNARSTGIFGKHIQVPSDINPNEPYINQEYTDLMNIIHRSSSR